MVKEVSTKYPPQRCYYCGVTGPVTRDHYLPFSLGGRGRANIVLCCALCNQVKADRTGDEYVAWLASPEGRCWYHVRGFHAVVIDNACPQCLGRRDSMRRKWLGWLSRVHPDAENDAPMPVPDR